MTEKGQMKIVFLKISKKVKYAPIRVISMSMYSKCNC